MPVFHLLRDIDQLKPLSATNWFFIDSELSLIYGIIREIGKSSESIKNHSST